MYRLPHIAVLFAAVLLAAFNDAQAGRFLRWRRCRSQAIAKKIMELPDASVCDEITDLGGVIAGMTDERILRVLGLQKYSVSLMYHARVVGGHGAGGVRTEYLGHLEGYRLTIISNLNGDRVLEWKSPQSNLIRIAL